MSEYEQQIERGKEIASKDILRNLARKLRRPEVSDSTFTVTDGDFETDTVSLVDREFHVVAKPSRVDLADCPADSSVRRRIETQLTQAIQVFYDRGC
jgi:hypothetical protein